MTSLHSALTQLDLHQPFNYEQTSDPGAVGAGKYWLDTTAAPFVLWRRNGTDTGWDAVGSSGGAAFAGARLVLSLNQTIPDSVETLITWDTVDFDTTSFTNLGVDATKITTPGTAGTYLVGCTLWFDTAAGGDRRVSLIFNGAGGPLDGVEVANQNGLCRLNFTTLVAIGSGNELQISVFQSSGAPLDVVADGPAVPAVPNFWIQKVG